MAAKLLLAVFGCFFSGLCLAATGEASAQPINLSMTDSTLGLTALALFGLAFVLVMVEEFTHLRKSKPIMLAAGIIWVIIAWIARNQNLTDEVVAALRHNILEYAELFLFLLVAMTYVNAMEERKVFDALRIWLIKRGFNFKQLFWITGTLTFFISPIADNLTTALIMCAVIMAVAKGNTKFVTLACVNIVVAANAGGAFSPFGDITTLMVWQKGLIPIHDFLMLFTPAVVNFLIPAACMHFAIPDQRPEVTTEKPEMLLGAKRVIMLFLATIALTVTLHNVFHLPPVVGMMTGLSFLQFMGYYLKKKVQREHRKNGNKDIDNLAFDVFKKIERVEWDTLLFFYGVVLCVGGLATLGYLAYANDIMYNQWGANLGAGFSQTPANIVVGLLSAVVDNIPVMFAVLTMLPDMSEGQWLLVTLTAGVGGSMLSIGSAAGVALMGQSKGMYTFFSHLRWSWAIALGYCASIAVHILVNYDSFSRVVGN